MTETVLAELMVELSTLRRADIGAALAGIPNASEHEIRKAFERAAAATAATDLPLSRLYRLLALAFEPVLHPDKAQDPFVPLMTFADGQRTLLPSDLAPGHLNLLQAAIDERLHSAFNARIADILWTCKHGTRHERATHAATAVHAYLADARERQLGDDWPLAGRSLERALRLSMLLDRRGQGLHKTARETAVEIANLFDTARQWAGVRQAQRLLQEFEIGDAATNAEICERAAVAAEAESHQLLAESLWGQAISWWQRDNNEARAEAAIRHAAELAVRQADRRSADSAGLAATFLEQAIKLLRRLPSAKRSGREAELHAKLAEHQARSLLEFGQVSASIDGRETWDRAEAAVKGKDLFNALVAFVMHARPVNVAKLRKRVDEDAGRFVFMHLASPVVTGEGGKTIKRVPSMDADKAEDREAAARFHMVRLANMDQDLIGRVYVESARCAIAAEHSVSATDLLPFMLRSGFVPTGREGQWSTAFAAGFQGEFTTATHLLVPQVEHGLRMLLRSAGETAVSMDRFGQQEDWNLNHILLREGRAATERILQEDTVFDLASLLVDRCGANLRNAVTHGLVDDGGLEGGLSRHLFWACLRLCMIPLIAHAEEARRERAEAADPCIPESNGGYHSIKSSPASE